MYAVLRKHLLFFSCNSKVSEFQENQIFPRYWLLLVLHEQIDVPFCNYYLSGTVNALFGVIFFICKELPIWRLGIVMTNVIQSFMIQLSLPVHEMFLSIQNTIYTTSDINKMHNFFYLDKCILTTQHKIRQKISFCNNECHEINMTKTHPIKWLKHKSFL